MIDKRCDECGAEMDADAIFCNECGHAHTRTFNASQFPSTVLAPAPSRPSPLEREEITPPQPTYPPAAEPTPSPPVYQSRDGSPISETLITAAKRRYKDAYHYARFIDTVGRVIKAVGFVGGGIAILIGFVAAAEAQRRSSFGPDAGGVMILAVAVAISIVLTMWLWGMLWRAAGQFLKASLDGAVQGSPFLSDLEKAEVMSLPTGASGYTDQGWHNAGNRPDAAEMPRTDFDTSPQISSWYEAALISSFQNDGWLVRKLGPLKTKKAALLCYLSPIILPAFACIPSFFFISILGGLGLVLGGLVLLASPFCTQIVLLKVKPHKAVPFVRFHAFQSLLLEGIVLSSLLIMSGFLAMLNLSQFDGAQVIPSVMWLVTVGNLVLLIFLCVKANAGVLYKLPVIGDWAANFAAPLKTDAANYVDLR